MEIAVFAIVVLAMTIILIWLESLSKKGEKTDKKMDEIEVYLTKMQELKKNKSISGVLMRNFWTTLGLKLN